MKKSKLTKLQELYPNYDYSIIDITNVDEMKLKTILVIHHYSITKLSNNDKVYYVVFDRFNDKKLKQLLESLKCDIKYFGNEDLENNAAIKGFEIVPGILNYDCNRMKYNISTNMCLSYMSKFVLSE